MSISQMIRVPIMLFCIGVFSWQCYISVAKYFKARIGVAVRFR